MWISPPTPVTISSITAVRRVNREIAVNCESAALNPGEVMLGISGRKAAQARRVLVDSGSLEEIEELVVRDRKHLSEEGVVIPIIAIDKHTGQVESAPEIVTRGLMSENGNEFLAGARDVVSRTVESSNLEERADWSVIKEKIRVDLKRYINKQTSKRPLILPVILEV